MTSKYFQVFFNILLVRSKASYIPKISFQGAMEVDKIFSTERPTDRQTDRPTDRQTNRQGEVLKINKYKYTFLIRLFIFYPICSI